MAQDFRELRVWEEAMRLAEMVYAVAPLLPADERFGLSMQIRKAAVSVPSCIAEGNGRASTADYLRFLSMARGSLSEVQTQALLAGRLDLLPRHEIDAILAQARTVGMLLTGLRRALASKTA
ncbi:four helix bundle protein [Coralloluteibacterium stylophorae]|uniref:Four helix bundle protein n=1 Tax=Coralloluteibacterium stylophorae TaxID=1776034 RepID=A0A8J7VW48_9GAMM|nr:four helix bundle protein [Coralloluteibacterium stylophorae]MBS7457763.1 four helix bundle protein [Coralloluteibacterium stylophorae]